MNRDRKLLTQLRQSVAGAAMTEFALALPFLLTVGLYGSEMVNFTITRMKVNEIATHLADNASRIGDTSTLQNRKIFESDVNDLFFGANIQATRTLNFFEHGRALISSLEVKPTNGKQYIHWQRCKGKKVFASDYGDEGDYVTNGMGPPGEEVTASANEGVIFVEVAYDYQPMVSAKFVGQPTIKSIASFVVRDKRDYSKIHQKKPLFPDPIADCGINTGFPALTL